MRTKIGHSPQNSCGTRFPHHIRPMRPNRCSALLPDPAISFSRRKPPPNKKATILARTASPDRVHPAVRIARPESAAVSAQHFVRQGERTSYPRGGAAIRTVPAFLRPYARSVSGPGLQTRPADADGSDMRRKRRSIFPQHAFLRTRRTGDELRNRIGVFRRNRCGSGRSRTSVSSGTRIRSSGRPAGPIRESQIGIRSRTHNPASKETAFGSSGSLVRNPDAPPRNAETGTRPAAKGALATNRRLGTNPCALCRGLTTPRTGHPHHRGDSPPMIRNTCGRRSDPRKDDRRQPRSVRPFLRAASLRLRLRTPSGRP